MRHTRVKLLSTLFLVLVFFAPSLGLFNSTLAFGQQTPPASQKVIKDPAEYNAYITALNTQDPDAKAAAMEAFVKQYPQSVVLRDALEQAMDAYRLAANVAKLEEVAKRILQLTPSNIRALTIVTVLDRAKATNGDQPALKEMCADAQAGLQQLPTWQKPEGLSDGDFDKLKQQMTDIFNGASGFCALQAKKFPEARDFLTKAFQIDPTNLQDVYQLAVADLETSPNDLNGMWYCSKAITLAQRTNNAQAENGMLTYCKAKYRKYHGGNDGWDQLMSGATAENALPPDFASRIKRAPTPAELAVHAVQENSVADLSFSDWEFILSFRDASSANKDAADKVWQAIQAKEKGGEARLKIPVKVISVTRDTIQAAITDEKQQTNQADLQVTMAKPMLHPPAAGAMIDIIGVITDYVPSPFRFMMKEGELPEKPSKAAPAKP